MENYYYSKKYTRDVEFTGYHGYHWHKGKPVNTPVKGGKKPKYLIGIELETVFPSEQAREKFCDKFASNIVYMEEDCSLPRGGCEFISIPLRPEDARSSKFWEPFIRTLSSADVQSWNHSACGLHVHISKSIFASDEWAVGRLLYLYNYVLDAGLRTAIFGRDSGYWATQLGESPKAKAVQVLPEALKMKKVKDGVCKELRDTNCRRELQINLRNSNTIEFRQGKGSVSAKRVAAVCDFVCLLCRYVRDHKDMSSYTKHDFIRFLKEKGTIELISYVDNER